MIFCEWRGKTFCLKGPSVSPHHSVFMAVCEMLDNLKVDFS